MQLSKIDFSAGKQLVIFELPPSMTKETFGPCQGRVCGSVVTQVLAAELGMKPNDVGAYRIRAPLKPIPVKALTSLAELSPKAGTTAR